MAKHALSSLKSIVGMASPFIFLFLITICIFPIEGCSLEEREALLQFKATLNDSNRHLSSWKGEDCCNWRGVDCYGKPRHVVKLDLHGLKLSNLSSHIDSSLFQLKYLRHLDLSDNEFYRMQLPLELGMLKALTYLDISYAGFEGDVPSELGNLSSLRYLDLSSSLYYYPSSMHSSGLEWVGSMSSLNYLSLDFMNLSTISTQSGNLSSIALLSSLDVLDLSSNTMLGVISETLLENLTKLSVLDLSGSGLATITLLGGFLLGFGIFHRTCFMSIFPEISWKEITSTRVSRLDVSFNKLSGRLPLHFGNGYFDMGILYLNDNNFIGEKSVNWSCADWNWKAEGVNVSQHFNEQIEWTNSTELESLDLSINNLSGTIPWGLESLSFMGTLNLSNNQLSGKIPRGGQMLTFKNSSFLGNPELCGDPLTKKCYPAGSYPPPPLETEEEEENGSEIPWWEIAMGLSYGVGFAGVVSVLAVHMEWRRRWFEMMDDFIYFFFHRRR
eukprot:Gb_05286 [translate_table: standard]